MKQPKRILLYQYLLLAIACFSLFSFKYYVPRTIKLAGLVVNALTLKPVKAANIYDADNHLLGATDVNGYFNVAMTYDKPGPISFTLKIKKKGLKSFIDQENWGDLIDDNKTVMYLGMTDRKSVARSFSNLSRNNSDLSYPSVRSGFTKIKQTQLFEQKLSSMKKGNENTLFNIDGSLYIADSDGWVKINSEDDLILINQARSVAAKDLNTIISRKDIRSITPLAHQKEKFGITVK